MCVCVCLPLSFYYNFIWNSCNIIYVHIELRENGLSTCLSICFVPFCTHTRSRITSCFHFQFIYLSFLFAHHQCVLCMYANKNLTNGEYDAGSKFKFLIISISICFFFFVKLNGMEIWRATAMYVCMYIYVCVVYIGMKVLFSSFLFLVWVFLLLSLLLYFLFIYLFKYYYY